jgi:hypothetical protein
MRSKDASVAPTLTSDKLEGTSLLVGLLLVVLGSVLLSAVQVLEFVSSSSLVGPLGLVHSVSDLGDLVVNVLESGSEGTVDTGLDGLSDGRGSDGLDELVQQVVVRVSDGELQGVDVDIDVLDREGAVTLVVGLEGDCGGERGQSVTASLAMLNTRSTNSPLTEIPFPPIKTSATPESLILGQPDFLRNWKMTSRRSAWIWLKPRVMMWCCWSGIDS